MKAHGTVHKYGDNVDTDVIIPARYLNTADPAELAKNCAVIGLPLYVRYSPSTLRTAERTISGILLSATLERAISLVPME